MAAATVSVKTQPVSAVGSSQAVCSVAAIVESLSSEMRAIVVVAGRQAFAVSQNSSGVTGRPWESMS